MMTIKHLALAVALLIPLALTGCGGDKPKEKVEETRPDLAIASMIANPDGKSGSCYIQLINGSKPITVNNSKAFPMGFASQPIDVFEKSIFTAPSYMQSSDLLRFDVTSSGTLVQAAKLTLPENCIVTHGKVISKEKGYLCAGDGRLLTFNPSTMKLLPTEIDLKPYAAKGIIAPSCGNPALVGDKLFLPLMQVDMKMMPATPPMIEILIIDPKSDKVIKRIEETKSGLANLGYPYGVQKNHFMDEKGDHYFVAPGMFSLMPNYKSGIIRVKKGTTEIDPSYNWVINDQDVEGEKGHGRWLVTTYYAGNGILYGLIDMPEYWANPMMGNWLTDRSLVAVEMNIYTRTVKKLPLPKTCAYAAHIAPYHGKILFASWGQKSSGFYLYDPETGKASDKALIEMPGFPLWCQEISLK